MIRTLIALLAVLTLSLVWGCGNKGPLYLPDEPAQANTEEEAQKR